MVNIYIGKSSSGKNMFYDKMIACGVKPIITYTTRPIRIGETDGKEYNFISTEEFLTKRDSGFFLESREYNTLVNGNPDIWYYGTPANDYNNENYVIILDVDGAKRFVEAVGPENVSIIFVDVDDDIRKERARLRGSFDDTEWERRRADDDIKFAPSRIKDLAKLINKPITRINNNGRTPKFSEIFPE